MVDIFNLANLVAVQVENVQFLKILEVPDISMKFLPSINTLRVGIVWRWLMSLI